MPAHRHVDTQTDRQTERQTYRHTDRQTDIQIDIQTQTDNYDCMYVKYYHSRPHFGDGPPCNHLHWYAQQKLTAKSVKPTQRKPKYNNTLPTYTCTQTQY